MVHRKLASRRKRGMRWPVGRGSFFQGPKTRDCDKGPCFTFPTLFKYLLAQWIGRCRRSRPAMLALLSVPKEQDAHLFRQTHALLRRDVAAQFPADRRP